MSIIDPFEFTNFYLTMLHLGNDSGPGSGSTRLQPSARTPSTAATHIGKHQRDQMFQVKVAETLQKWLKTCQMFGYSCNNKKLPDFSQNSSGYDY